MSTDETTPNPTTDSAVTVAEPPAEKAPRRFPPPCWTQDETLALIEAYRERWYALRRGYLRTADWDAVAVAVATRCPGASPAKTSAQCRHKMEKLRQKYRAEKQRALSYPYPAGRYLSSWFFFENMDAMEHGTTAPTSIGDNQVGSGDGSSKLKTLLDQNILKLKLKARSVPELGLLGSSSVGKAKRSNSNEQYPYSDVGGVGQDDDDDDDDDDDILGFGRRKPMNGMSKVKNSSKMFNKFDASGGGFYQEMLPPGLRMKKVGKFDQFMGSDSNRSHSNEEFWGKVGNHNADYCFDSGAPEVRGKGWGSSKANGDSVKRGRDTVEEIVDSIRLLGEGFVKMETAKMEMAREMEAMRMEMEMKRNEMILESQKQIVDAFVKGLVGFNKKGKKAKSDLTTPAADPSAAET